jgi:hypothetical protein
MDEISVECVVRLRKDSEVSALIFTAVRELVLHVAENKFLLRASPPFSNDNIQLVQVFISSFSLPVVLYLVNGAKASVSRNVRHLAEPADEPDARSRLHKTQRNACTQPRVGFEPPDLLNNKHIL